MSIKAMTFIWEHSEQNNTRLLMLLAIADHCNDEGFCWPGIESLGKKARLEAYNSALAMIRKLEEAGELASVSEPGKLNYFYLPKYCKYAGIDVDKLKERLEKMSNRTPNQMSGGRASKPKNVPPPDEGDTPHETNDDPPPNEGDTPHETKGTPPMKSGDESSEKSSVETSKKESSGESSSSKGKPEEDDDFNLSDKELSILCDAFGSIGARAKGCLAKDRDLTIGWAKYVLATRICFDPGDKYYVDIPPAYIFKCVSNGDPVKELPVESAEHKAKREFAAMSDDEKAAKLAADEIAEKKAEAQTAKLKNKGDAVRDARLAKESAKAEADRIEAARLQAEAERDAKLWFDKLEVDRREWRECVEKKSMASGGVSALDAASHQLFKRIRPTAAAKCGSARKKYHRFIFHWKRRQFADELRLVDYVDEEIVRDDGSVLSVKAPIAIYGYRSGDFNKIFADYPEPFIRIMSALQYQERYVENGQQ